MEEYIIDIYPALFVISLFGLGISCLGVSCIKGWYKLIKSWIKR